MNENKLDNYNKLLNTVMESCVADFEQKNTPDIQFTYKEIILEMCLRLADNKEIAKEIDKLFISEKILINEDKVQEILERDTLEKRINFYKNTSSGLKFYIILVQNLIFSNLENIEMFKRINIFKNSINEDKKEAIKSLCKVSNANEYTIEAIKMLESILNDDQIIEKTFEMDYESSYLGDYKSIISYDEDGDELFYDVDVELDYELVTFNENEEDDDTSLDKMIGNISTFQDFDATIDVQRFIAGDFMEFEDQAHILLDSAFDSRYMINKTLFLDYNLVSIDERKQILDAIIHQGAGMGLDEHQIKLSYYNAMKTAILVAKIIKVERENIINSYDDVIYMLKLKNGML